MASSAGLCDSGAPNTLYGPNIAIQTCLLALTTTLVALRSYVRVRISKIWAFEDSLCILQLILFAIYVGLVSKSIDIGGGCSLADTSPTGIGDLLYWDNVIQIFYNIVLVTTKLTLLCMYLNLFAPTKFTLRWWAIVAMMIANVLFFTASTFFKIFMCTPRALIWDKSLQGTCIADVAQLLTATAGFNTASDFLVVAIPGLFISRLQFRTRLKMKVILCFLLAAIHYPLFSVIGIVYRKLHGNDPDTTYWQTRILVFVEAEIAMGIICSCIPAVQRLVRIAIGADHTVVALERQKNHVHQLHTYKNIERPRRPRFNSWDTRLFTTDLSETEGVGRNRSTATSPFRPSHIRGKSVALEPLPNEPAATGILRTTNIEISYEPSELPTKSKGGESDEALETVNVQTGTFLAG